MSNKSNKIQNGKEKYNKYKLLNIYCKIKRQFLPSKLYSSQTLL